MKKKACLLLIASMALGACDLNDLMFWKDWFESPKQEEQKPDEGGEQQSNGEQGEEKSSSFTIQQVLTAFDNLAQANSVTITTEVSYSGTDSTSFGGEYIPTEMNVSMNYVSEQVGKDSKTVMNYSTTEIVNLTTAKTLLGISKEEVIDLAIKQRNQYLTYGYNREVSFDLEKDELILGFSIPEEVTFTIYDQEADQTYSYNEDEITKYNITNDGIGIIDSDDIKEVIRNGNVNGDEIIAEIDGQSMAIKVSLSGEYLESLEANIDAATHLKISYSRYNKTSFEIPAEAHKPTCKWAHDAYTPYNYLKTEQGHRKYCKDCYKFLSETKPHNHAHNDKGYCENCGYVDGEDDVNYETPIGFERGNDDYYLQVKVVGDVFASSEINFNSDFDYLCSDRITAWEMCSYRVFADEGVVVKFHQSTFTFIDDTCLVSQIWTLDLYKNLSSTELKNMQPLDYDARLETLKTYLTGKTVSSTFSGYKLHNEHSSCTNYESIVLDECHTQQVYSCNVTGEIINNYVLTDHKADFVDTRETLDSCHTLVKHECPICHEFTEEIEINHVEGTPIIEEQAIDACHKLVISKCATCGEVLDKQVVANHVGGTHAVTFAVDSCETKTLTICNSCNVILDSQSVFDHKHVTHVECDYETLRTYEFAKNVQWFSGIFVFDYCSDCKKPVNNEVKEMPLELAMDHQYVDSQYKIHHISEEGDETTEVYFHVDHEFDENGVCIHCHSKVYDLGTSTIGFIAKYKTSYQMWTGFFFFNKETGERISLYDFDNYPDLGEDSNGEYCEYRNDSYPGIKVKRYGVSYDSTMADRLEVSYNNFTETVVILPSDFAGY